MKFALLAGNLHWTVPVILLALAGSFWLASKCRAAMRVLLAVWGLVLLAVALGMFRAAVLTLLDPLETSIVAMIVTALACTALGGFFGYSAVRLLVTSFARDAEGPSQTD